LNRHASIVPSNSLQPGDKFHKSFAEFVDLFERSNFDETYLQGDKTAVEDAYWLFLKYCENDVVKVPV